MLYSVEFISLFHYQAAYEFGNVPIVMVRRMAMCATSWTFALWLGVLISNQMRDTRHRDLTSCDHADIYHMLELYHKLFGHIADISPKFVSFAIRTGFIRDTQFY